MEKLSVEFPEIRIVGMFLVSYFGLVSDDKSNKGKRTFRNGKKTNNGHSIAVCSTHAIVNIANGHIEWVVLVVAGSD